MDTAVLPKLLENLISPNEHLRFPATVLFEELRKEPEKTICCLMENTIQCFLINVAAEKS